MMQRVRVIVGILSAVLVLVAFLPSAKADMDRPEWGAGDFWVYTYQGDFSSVSGSGAMRMDVLGRATVSVGSVSYDTFHVRLAVNLTQGQITFNIPGEAWYRTSDLATVRQSLTMTYTVGPLTMTVITNVSFNPPAMIRWPLTTDKSWSETTTVTTVVHIAGLPDNTDTSTETLSFLVQAAGPTVVPAGTFDTTPLRTSMGGDYTVSDWSSVVGNYVRQRAFNDADELQSEARLTSYKYQGPISMLVIIGLVIILFVIVAVALIAASRRRRKSVYVAQAPMPPPPPR